MEVIKHKDGDSLKRFRCKCGCEFKASDKEYRTKTIWSSLYMSTLNVYMAICPECKRRVKWDNLPCKKGE